MIVQDHPTSWRIVAVHTSLVDVTVRCYQEQSRDSFASGQSVSRGKNSFDSVEKISQAWSLMYRSSLSSYYPDPRDRRQGPTRTRDLRGSQASGRRVATTPRRQPACSRGEVHRRSPGTTRIRLMFQDVLWKGVRVGPARVCGTSRLVRTDGERVRRSIDTDRRGVRARADLLIVVISVVVIATVRRV